MLYTLRFFPSKCSLFHNANLFGSCIIHILYRGCAKIKKNNSGTKGLTSELDGEDGQRNTPAALSPGKTRYPSYRRLGGPQRQSGQVRKTSP